MVKTRGSGSRHAAASGSAQTRPSRTRATSSYPRVNKHPRIAQPKTFHIDESSDADEQDESSDDTSDDSSSSLSDIPSDNDLASSRTSAPQQPATRRSTRQSNPPKMAAAATRSNTLSTSRKTNRSRSKRGVTKLRGRSMGSGRIQPLRSSPTKRRRKELTLPVVVPQGVIPNWLTPEIPYHIWKDIFTYAASDGSTDVLRSAWLWRTATVCQAWKEPALAALYANPMLKTANKARRFVATLQLDLSATTINYRSKVTTLHLDISVIPQPLYFDLLRPLPALRDLIIYTPLDQPPYRSLDKTVRWSYGNDIFAALDPVPPRGDPEPGTILPPNHTRLRSWEWSARLLDFSLHEMAAIHQRDVFSHLTKVGFINFQVPSLKLPPPADGDEETALRQHSADGAVIDAVAHAISQLQDLTHLRFESSTVMNYRLLPLLPPNLTQLDLINCWEVRSEELASFLSTHGRQLRVLNLLSCQSLDLAFLPTLAESSPQLEVLNMDMSYYRHHESVDDDDPMYETALEPDQIPIWPSTLRKVQIEYIRQWSTEAATNFLQSLVDQAENLPDLRHLVIKTILNIPWQVRATMRQEWRLRLEKVFLRPHQHQPSDNPTVTAGTGSVQITGGDESDSSPRKRRRTTDAPSRRSGRLVSQEESHNEHDDSIQVPFIQGLCHTVSITFDNQKPRELQYGMQDFLSEESESEEEWDGDRDEEDFTVF